MSITIQFFNRERTILGFAYEMLRMCNSYDEEKNPIIEEWHVFTIGLLFINIDISFK